MTAAQWTDLQWLITRLRREQGKPATHRPRRHRRASRHRCGCANSGGACSHIAAAALSASTTTEGDPT